MTARNRKLTSSEMLRLPVLKAESLNQEIMNLELMGHYATDSDPLTRSLYKAAHEKWGAQVPNLKLVTAPAPTDFTGRTKEQVEAGINLIHEDFSQCVHLPWPSLHQAIGHGVLPYQLWTAAAESGHGKTTFAMNVVKGLVAQGKRVYVIGLEQAAPVLRVYLAALKLGFSTRYALANRWNQLPPSAQAAIESDLREQETEAELLHFSNADFLTLRTLAKALEEAQAFGAQLILIDHVHHVRVESGNSAGEFTKLCQGLSDFSKKHQIPVLAMAQLNRGNGPIDRLKPYLPPALDNIKMGKVLEEVSSVVLGLYRPLFNNITAQERARIRLGESVKPFIKANTMGVAVLKSRIGGECGDIVDLKYDRGHISDWPADQVGHWSEGGPESLRLV